MSCGCCYYIKFLGNMRLQALEAEGEGKWSQPNSVSILATERDPLCCVREMPIPRHLAETGCIGQRAA